MKKKRIIKMFQSHSDILYQEVIDLFGRDSYDEGWNLFYAYKIKKKKVKQYDDMYPVKKSHALAGNNNCIFSIEGFRPLIEKRYVCAFQFLIKNGKEFHLH